VLPHPARCRSAALVLAVIPAISLGFFGCSQSDFRVEVIANYPDGVALAQLEVTALPFDREALRDSLAEASASPRPRFAELEEDLASYERPDISQLTEAFLPWQAIHDSVKHLADSLSNAGADSSPQYAMAYDRLREQYQRLAQSSVDRDAALKEQVGDDRQLAARAAAAADSLRAWEASALDHFPALADSAMARDDRGIHVATTNAEGIAEFRLAPGRWWIVSTWVDPENPFREYHWNVGVVVRRFGGRLVPLHEGNGTGKWRY